ncbi:MAG: MerC domain-containing protein [Pseudomonadota bacterium]
MPETVPKPAPHLHKADRVGVVASFLCAAHCALLPVVIALLPAFGVAGALNEYFEEAFAVFATVLGLVALITGYRRHRALHALALLVPGLLVVWVGVLYPPLHHSVLPHAVAMTIGGCLVALAHLANLRLTREFGHSGPCDATCAR